MKKEEGNGIHSLKKQLHRVLLQSEVLQYIALPLLVVAAFLKYMCLDNSRRSKKVFAMFICVFMVFSNTATLFAEEAGMLQNPDPAELIVQYQGEESTEPFTGEEYQNTGEMGGDQTNIGEGEHLGTSDENQESKDNSDNGSEDKIDSEEGKGLQDENGSGENGEQEDETESGENNEPDIENNFEEDDEFGDETDSEKNEKLDDKTDSEENKNLDEETSSEEDKESEDETDSEEDEESKDETDSEEDEESESETDSEEDEDLDEETTSEEDSIVEIENWGEYVHLEFSEYTQILQYGMSFSEENAIIISLSNEASEEPAGFEVYIEGDFSVEGDIPGILEADSVYCWKMYLPQDSLVGEYESSIRIMIEDEIIEEVNVKQCVVETQIQVELPSFEVLVGDELPQISADLLNFSREITEEEKCEFNNIMNECDICFSCEDTSKAGVYETVAVEPIVFRGYEVSFIPGYLTINPRVPDEAYFTVEGEISRLNEDIFVGEIIIRPTGIDGFDRISINGSEEYLEEIVLTQEGMMVQSEFVFIKENAVTEPYIYSYNCDYTAPEIISINSNSEKSVGEELADWFWGVRNISYKVEIHDEVSGIDFLHYQYGNDSFTVPVTDGVADAIVDNHFEGRISFYCMDKAGNVSETKTAYQVIDSQAPSLSFVSFQEDTQTWDVCEEINTGDLNTLLRVYVSEEGEIKSGIQQLECYINDEIAPIQPMLMNITMLSDGSQVATNEYFDLVLEKSGEYYIHVTATDEMGNQTDITLYYRIIDNKIIKVVIPTDFTFMINPYNLNDSGQLHSEPVNIVNLSDFDVEIETSVVLTVNHDNESEISKNAAVGIEFTQDNVVVPITEGNNQDIYTFVVPTANSSGTNSKGETTSILEYSKLEEVKLEEDEENDEDGSALPDDDENSKNVKSFRVTGSLSEGSERSWRDGDISMTVVFDFHPVDDDR